MLKKFLFLQKLLTFQIFMSISSMNLYLRLTLNRFWKTLIIMSEVSVEVYRRCVCVCVCVYVKHLIYA